MIMPSSDNYPAVRCGAVQATPHTGSLELQSGDASTSLASRCTCSRPIWSPISASEDGDCPVMYIVANY